MSIAFVLILSLIAMYPSVTGGSTEEEYPDPLALIQYEYYVMGDTDYFSLDATDSYNPDNKIKEFRWEFEEEGIVTDVATGPFYQFDLNQSGHYAISLQVTSVDGDKSYSNMTLEYREDGTSSIGVSSHIYPLMKLREDEESDHAESDNTVLFVIIGVLILIVLAILIIDVIIAVRS